MNESQAMLSRVADSLYWMSRYLERSENTARLIDVHINSMLDMNLELIEDQRLQRLEEALAMGTETGIDFENDDILHHLTFSPAQAISITSTVMSARENARQIREQISSEMWTQINKLFLLVTKADSEVIWETNLHNFYLQVREGSHLFQGITDATMNHNQGWHFIQIGRYIERSLSLLQLLDVHFRDTHLESQQNIEPNTYFEMVTILKSVSAFEAYCKVYNPNLQSLLIVEFLLFNQEFPRSLRFCVEMIQHSLQALADATGRSKNSKLYRMSGRLQSNLSYDEIQDIDDLSRYLTSIKEQIYQIHVMLYDTFITYTIDSAL
jgi:uncharacterized alpha-E superfamily protein